MRVTSVPCIPKFTLSHYGANSRQIQLNTASLRILGEVESCEELTYACGQEERLLAASVVRPALHAACGTFRVDQEPLAKLRGTPDRVHRGDGARDWRDTHQNCIRITAHVRDESAWAAADCLFCAEPPGVPAVCARREGPQVGLHRPSQAH